MKKLFLTLTACILTLGLWADTSVTVVENFSTVGNVATGTYTWTGDLCTWNAYLTARRAQDTIYDANQKQAIWMSVSSAGAAKVSTTDFEGGIKAVEFKYARYGSEKTAGRVLQLKVKVGNDEYNTPTYANNAMKQGAGGGKEHETYSHAFNSKSNEAQLTIENISTYTEALSTSGICRICVGDITITPYLLYRNKEVTIGSKQRGFINKDLIDNTGGEGTIAYSSSNESVATVDGDGVITPVAAGDAIITASWSEGASTTYTLHVVDGIIVESFTKVGNVSSVVSGKSDSWKGDLYSWNVRSTRRGVNDTIGLNPRIQAVWIQKNTTENSYIETPTAFDGGVKHVAFRWRQWGSETGTLKLALYAAGKTGGWGSALYNDEQAAATANTEFNFDADVDDGTHNYVKLKLSNESSGSTKTHRIVIENIKITPWLLYTTKEATLYTGDALTFTNNDLINNTSGDPVEYSIAPTGEGATINSSTGEVTVDNATEGDFTITATWGAVTTTYTLHVLKPKYYITGIGGWDLKQVAVYEDSYTFEDLPADSYALKVTDGDSWDTSKGFSHLTASEVVAGLYSGGDNNNICFTLAEAGNVTVTYTNEVFKLEGAFTPQVVKVKGAWDEWATTHLMDISEDRKSASITMELPAADEVQFGIDINGDDYRANQYGFKREYNTETGITGNTGNMKLTSDKAGDYTFTWIFGTNTLTITFPEILVYRVAGDEELMGSDWNTGDDDNAMTLNEGIYKLTKTPITLNAATYKYKVVGDNTWRIAYPSDNAELTINARGVYSVEFTFNPSTKAVTAEATYLGPATAIDETDVKAKAEKKVVDGQLIIEKNGVRYNVIGQAL